MLDDVIHTTEARPSQVTSANPVEPIRNMDDALSMIRSSLFIGLVLASGCFGDSESWTSAEETLEIEACHGQVTDSGDGFTLGNVTLDGDDLLVDVQAGGGCEPHRFAMCWNGIAALSQPPQIGLELTHDAHDPCLALLSFQLRVDTSSLRARGLTPVIVRVFGEVSRKEGTTNTVTLGD